MVFLEEEVGAKCRLQKFPSKVKQIVSERQEVSSKPIYNVNTHTQIYTCMHMCALAHARAHTYMQRERVRTPDFNGISSRLGS